jgi:DNA (cytosine-5)-methyltransferase 1
MNHGSLFSGIGGFDLASQWMGWDNIFHCEWNDFGQRVLKHHFPNSISYGDITTTDFTIHRGQIDILTGGFPCQPYSQAGKRLGKEDDRHLWPEMLRAIREIQPRWVVGENVLGLVNWNGGLVFDEVQADLENEGYVVQPYVLPACAVNAPHRRDRVWFVAYSESNGGSRTSRSASSEIGRQDGGEVEQLIKRGKVRNATNANGNGQHGRNGEHEIEPSQRGIYAQRDVEQIRGHASNPYGIGCRGWDKQPESNQPKEREIHSDKQQHGNGVWSETTGCCSANTDTNSAGLQEAWPKQQATGFEQYGELHGGAIGWANFPTQSPICGGDDGLPTELDGITFPKWRQESVKAYGNAIVPQVAHQIFKAIQTYEVMT